MLQEKSSLPSPPSCSRASALYPSVNRRPRVWGAGDVLGMWQGYTGFSLTALEVCWGCTGFSLTAGSHKAERKACFGHKLSQDAVPLTAMACTGSGAARTKPAPSLPSGSASA